MTKRHETQQKLAKLRHVEKMAASGRPISDCVPEIGVTEVTYYRWRNRLASKTISPNIWPR